MSVQSVLNTFGNNYVKFVRLFDTDTGNKFINNTSSSTLRLFIPVCFIGIQLSGIKIHLNIRFFLRRPLTVESENANVYVCGCVDTGCTTLSPLFI